MDTKQMRRRMPRVNVCVGTIVELSNKANRGNATLTA
jgi:hypothetical protein